MRVLTAAPGNTGPPWRVHQSDDQRHDDEERYVKPVEIGVGAGAAVITAFASSSLGTAGTLTGAALASVVGTVSASVLRNSADRSAERLRRTTARLRETGRVGPGPGRRPAGTATAATSTGDQVGPDGSPAEGIGGRTGRPKWLALAAGAVVAFAVALVAITGIEWAAGKPLAGLVGKQTGGGTTIGHATGTDSGSTEEESPAPTPTVTPTGGPAATSTGTTTESTPTGEPTTSGSAPAPSTTDPAPPATVPVPTQAPTATIDPLTSTAP